MGDDILLKTSLMGFNKKEVMDYVEALQKENHDLKEKLRKLEEEKEKENLPAVSEEGSNFVPFTLEDISMDALSDDLRELDAASLNEAATEIKTEEISEIDALESDLVKALEKAEQETITETAAESAPEADVDAYAEIKADDAADDIADTASEEAAAIEVYTAEPVAEPEPEPEPVKPKKRTPVKVKVHVKRKR